MGSGANRAAPQPELPVVQWVRLHRKAYTTSIDHGISIFEKRYAACFVADLRKFDQWVSSQPVLSISVLLDPVSTILFGSNSLAFGPGLPITFIERLSFGSQFGVLPDPGESRLGIGDQS